MPRLTVLMAVRNGERTVGEAVESILGQSFSDFEFLVVNDNSTDGTGAVLGTFNDARLTVIANERRQGLTRSLNRGLAQTTTAYIARQDADDRSAPERLERQVAFLDSHPDVALAGTWYRKIDEQGRVLASQQLPCTATDLRWHLIFYSPFVHSAVVFRRSVLDVVGTYDEHLHYAQDYDLWCRIARSFELANLDEYLVDFRVSEASMTATYGSTVIEEPRQVAREYLGDLYGNAPPPDEPYIETISALLFRPHLVSPSEDAGRAASAALHHHDAFSAYFELSEDERLARRKRLSRQLACRLARLAPMQLRRGRVRQAARLLSAASTIGLGSRH